LRNLIGSLLLCALSLVSLPSHGNGFFSYPAQPLIDAPPFSHHTGRPALVVLFQPECPHCLNQFRAAQSFANAHPQIAVVCLSIRGEPQDLLRELRRARIKLPAYRSSPALLAALNRPETTPQTYAVNAAGAVVAVARGTRSAAQLAALVADTWGKPPSSNVSQSTRPRLQQSYSSYSVATSM